MDSTFINLLSVGKNIEVIYTGVVAIIAAVLAIWGHFRINKANKRCNTEGKI